MIATKYEGIRFTDPNRMKTDEELRRLQQVLYITWIYRDDLCIVSGILENEDIEFTCFKSVHVYVSGLMRGMEIGYYTATNQD